VVSSEQRLTGTRVELLFISLWTAFIFFISEFQVHLLCSFPFRVSVFSYY
jgi:hypothetical protein